MIKWICGYDQMDMWIWSNGYDQMVCVYDQIDTWIWSNGCVDMIKWIWSNGCVDIIKWIYGYDQMDVWIWSNGCGYDQMDMRISSNKYVDMIKWMCGYDQAFSQKGVQASWDAPRTKNERLWTPKFWKKGKLFSIISLRILIYLKQNSFNSHYYYTLDILINLMVYLAEWKCRS
jgi:hypothetical protein